MDDAWPMEKSSTRMRMHVPPPPSLPSPPLPSPPRLPCARQHPSAAADLPAAAEAPEPSASGPEEVAVAAEMPLSVAAEAGGCGYDSDGGSVCGRGERGGKGSSILGSDREGLERREKVGRNENVLEGSWPFGMSIGGATHYRFQALCWGRNRVKSVHRSCFWGSLNHRDRYYIRWKHRGNRLAAMTVGGTPVTDFTRRSIAKWPRWDVISWSPSALSCGVVLVFVLFLFGSIDRQS